MAASDTWRNRWLLSCSNFPEVLKQQQSDTVLTEFVSATCEFAIPFRVRSDLGGENVGVWRFMEEEGLNVPHTLPAAVLIILESNVSGEITAKTTMLKQHVATPSLRVNPYVHMHQYQASRQKFVHQLKHGSRMEMSFIHPLTDIKGLSTLPSFINL